MECRGGTTRILRAKNATRVERCGPEEVTASAQIGNHALGNAEVVKCSLTQQSNKANPFSNVLPYDPDHIHYIPIIFDQAKRTAPLESYNLLSQRSVTVSVGVNRCQTIKLVLQVLRYYQYPIAIIYSQEFYLVLAIRYHSYFTKLKLLVIIEWETRRDRSLSCLDVYLSPLLLLAQSGMQTSRSMFRFQHLIREVIFLPYRFHVCIF